MGGGRFFIENPRRGGLRAGGAGGARGQEGVCGKFGGGGGAKYFVSRGRNSHQGLSEKRKSAGSIHHLM